MERVNFVLSEEEMPSTWYDVLADLPEPLPPVLHPATGEPVKPEDLVPLVRCILWGIILFLHRFTLVD